MDTLPTILLRRAAGPACLVAGLLAGVLAAAAGCRDATAPAPAAPEPAARFVPDAAVVQVDLGGWSDFRLVPPPGSEPRVRWQRPGEPEAVGERYRYFARRQGSEILRVRAEDAAGRTWTRAWSVTVTPGGEPRADFRPASPDVDAYATVAAVFAVVTPWPVAGVTWHLDGAVAGTESVLSFTPGTPGPRQVAATVQIGDTTLTRAWAVTVHPFADAAPPPVAGLDLAAGNAPGRAVLSWDRVDGSVLPLVGYEIRYRWDGPPTEGTWPSDPDPGDHPWVASTARHSVQFTPEDAGLEPGREVWFAVRARNERGQLSPAGEGVRLRLPGEWWIEGTVRDPDGSPLADVTVQDRARQRLALTAADGTYRLGPFFELSAVEVQAGTAPGVEAGTGWHLSRGGVLTADGARRQDFILIPRLGCDPGCFNFGSDFLAYLRTMTLTRVPNARRPDVALHHWPEYPIPVHVPAWVSGRGVDYGAAVREAVAIWNASLDEPIFTVVDDPAAARVAFRYDLAGDINYGVVELDRPGDGTLVIGDVQPQHASVRITPDVPAGTACLEIAAHELGHVLGLQSHAYCNDVPYIMYVSSLGSMSRGAANLIHPDERRVVQLIRRLPSGLDMGLYPLDEP